MKEIKLVYHRFDEDGIVTNIVVKVSGTNDVKDLSNNINNASNEVLNLSNAIDSAGNNKGIEKLKNAFGNLDIQRFAGKKLTEEQKRASALDKLIDKASKQDIVSDKSLSNMKSLVTMARNYNEAIGINKGAGNIFETLTDRFDIDKPEAFQAMVLSGEKIHDELKLDRDDIKNLSKDFDTIKSTKEVEASREAIINRINNSREESINSAKNESQIIETTNKSLEKRISLLRQELSLKGETGISTDTPARDLQELKRVMMGRNEETALSFLQQNAGNMNVLSMEKIKEGFAGAREEAQKFKDTTQTISDAVFDKMDEKGVTAFSDINQEIHWSDQAVESLLGKTQELSNTFVRDTLSSAVRFGRTLSRIWDSLFRIGSNKHNPYAAYSKYVESANLFNTAFGKGLEETDGKIHDFSDRAQGWADRISEGLHLDPVELYQYSGALYSLVKGMGVAEEQAYVMGTNLTQLAYDMTSYLNLESYEAGFEKIRSAISGQSRAVATAGVPMQMESLEELADALGIDKSVSKMTQAEKTVMRYIALMRATGDIQMDLGKTINSPENALKSLKQSLQMVSVAIGQLITPIITKAIPLFIALANVIQEAAQSLAKFFGIEIDSDYSRGSSAFTDIFNNISESADGATGSINRSLAAFDDLNVVESESSGKGGAGTAGSILNELYKYLDEYDMLGKLKKEFNESISSMETKIKSLIPWVLGATGAFVIFKSAVKLGNTVNWISKVGSSIKNIGTWFGKPSSAEDVARETKKIKDTMKASDEIGSTAKGGFGAELVSMSKSIVKAFVALGEIIIGVSVLFALVGEIKKLDDKEFKGIISSGIDTTVEIFKKLTPAVPSIVAFGAIAYALGSLDHKSMVSGLAGLASIFVGLEAIVAITGLLYTLTEKSKIIDTGIKVVCAIFESLGNILIPLSAVAAVSVALSKLGGAATITSGIIALSEIIGVTEILMVATGSVVTLIDSYFGSKGLNLTTYDMVANGMDLLVLIFQKIGEAAGALVSGIGVGLTDGLPDIGSNLSEFAQNAQGFFNLLNNIEADAGEKGVSLAKAVTAFMSADFKASVASILGFEGKLKDVGKELSSFASSVKTYFDITKDISTASVDSTANLLNALSKFYSFKTELGYIIDYLLKSVGAETGLSLIGSELSDFGKSISSFFSKVKNVTSDDVQHASDVVEAVGKFKEMSKYQGLIDWIINNNSLKNLGEELVSFGKSFASFVDEIDMLSDNDLKLVKNVFDLTDKLITMYDQLPEYKFLNTINVTESNLKGFGSDLVDYGSNFASFYKKIKDVDTNKIKAIREFTTSIVNDMERYKSGKLDTTLGQYVSSLSNLGTTISNSLSSALGSSSGSSWGNTFGSAFATSMATKIKNKFNAGTLNMMDGTKNVGAYKLSISGFANGGMPTSGDLFFANENGAAEYITSVGNRTAVANQDQMVQAITGAITQSLGNVGGRNGDVVVYIGNDKVYQGQGTYQSRQSDRYGTTYVKI